MNDDLVLLTSYFNLSNGRRQDSADTFRVEPSVPSRTSPDGNAALYIMTEASASGHMGPRARRQTADTIAWEYASRGDEPPAPRLRAALRTAHEEIAREFDGHVSVGVSVIAVERNDVFLAQVPPAQVYVLHEGSLHSMPAAAGGSSPFARALGSSTGPQISVYRDQIAAGDVLALCSSWFNRTADADSLRECFGAGSADDIAACLLDLGKDHGIRDATVIVIEAMHAADLDEGEGESQTFMEQVDMAVQALAGVGRMLMAELRPPANDRSRNGHDGADYEADEDLALAGIAAREVERGPTQRRRVAPEDLTHEVPAVTAEPGDFAAGSAFADEAPLNDAALETMPPETVPRQEQATDEMSAVAAPEAIDEDEPVGREEGDRTDEPEAPRRRWPGSRRSAQPGSEIDAVNSRLQAGSDMADVIPPVQAFPDTSTEPERIYATSKDIRHVNRRPRRFGGISRPQRDEGAPMIRPGLANIDLRRPMPREAPPTLVWLGAALVALLVIVAGVLFLRHRHGTPVAANNPYPALVAAEIRKAQASKLPYQQDAHLRAAARDIRLARENGSKPAKLAALNLQLQTARDGIYRITRVSAPVIVYSWSKTPNAQPGQLASGPNTLFVLDSGQKGVYSLAQGSNSSPSQIVQSGEQDSGITIGTPTQLTNAQSVALVLDSNNYLVRDDGGTKTAVLLPAPSPAQKIASMANVGQTVYTLDVAGDQIWQYSNAVAGTPSAASPLLSNGASSLSQGVSLTTDDKFAYVLTSGGQILKYDLSSGTAQAFKQPAQAIRSALPRLHGPVSVFTDVGLPYVWVADPANSRIVQFDKAGNYIREYKSGAAGMDLSQIRGLVVPPSGKFIYVVSGKSLFQFPVVS
ncbi:MAG TPA: hypothetical protein VKX16_11200 [Chloroflexota bacterium]|nr:hypothetical protein [Chloroflexota bacterium]